MQLSLHQSFLCVRRAVRVVVLSRNWLGNANVDTDPSLRVLVAAAFPASVLLSIAF